MPRRALAALLLSACILNPVHSRGRFAGEFDNVPPATRDWFRSVKSPNGVSCCDIADGHHTTWRAAGNGIEVPIGADPDGSPHWVPVPLEAIIYNAGNPNEDSIVWYVEQAPGSFYVRCFVFGGGV